MLGHTPIGGLAEAALNANLEANAPPTRMKGLRRASRWAERTHADKHGTAEPSTRSLGDLQEELYAFYEGGSSRSPPSKSAGGWLPTCSTWPSTGR